MGAFSLGQAAPCLQDFSVALGAAGFIYDTIDRVSGNMPCCSFCTRDSYVYLYLYRFDVCIIIYCGF